VVEDAPLPYMARAARLPFSFAKVRRLQDKRFMRVRK